MSSKITLNDIQLDSDQENKKEVNCVNSKIDQTDSKFNKKNEIISHENLLIIQKGDKESFLLNIKDFNLLLFCLPLVLITRKNIYFYLFTHICIFFSIIIVIVKVINRIFIRKNQALIFKILSQFRLAIENNQKTFTCLGKYLLYNQKDQMYIYLNQMQRSFNNLANEMKRILNTNYIYFDNIIEISDINILEEFSVLSKILNESKTKIFNHVYNYLNTIRLHQNIIQSFLIFKNLNSLLIEIKIFNQNLKCSDEELQLCYRTVEKKSSKINNKSEYECFLSEIRNLCSKINEEANHESGNIENIIFIENLLEYSISLNIKLSNKLRKLKLNKEVIEEQVNHQEEFNKINSLEFENESKLILQRIKENQKVKDNTEQSAILFEVKKCKKNENIIPLNEIINGEKEFSNTKCNFINELTNHIETIKIENCVEFQDNEKSENEGSKYEKRQTSRKNSQCFFQKNLMSELTNVLKEKELGLDEIEFD